MLDLTGWRGAILKEFLPGSSPLTLVSDPDGLLLEQEVQQQIRKAGYDVYLLEDLVSLRYVYETEYRAAWDAGQNRSLVVVLREPPDAFESLPFDILSRGRTLVFTLGNLFPDLSYPVLAQMELRHLDAVARACSTLRPGRLGDNASMDFILRHVYGIHPELVQSDVDLLRLLLRHHQSQEVLPQLLRRRLLAILRRGGRFSPWPLEPLLSDRAGFLAFLQDQWQLYLDRLAGEPPDGPELLVPFDRQELWVYLDTLFLQGALRPVAHPASRQIEPWAAVGVVRAPDAEILERACRLLKMVQDSLPGIDATHLDWQRFAPLWAELSVLRHSLPHAHGLEAEFDGLRASLDDTFQAWMLRRYPGLHNQPPVPPLMAHHVARALARCRSESGNPRVALIVLDGLALDQWILLRDALAAQAPSLVPAEATIFAWVPTLTSVSRQAIFSGKVPLNFPGSLQTTQKEPVLWENFWLDQGVASDRVFYLHRLGNGALEGVEELLSHPRAEVLGLVVDTIDRIMHGMKLGMAGMHNQVLQWARQGFLARLLKMLLDKDFQVFLTADHGNVEAAGMGRPREGALAESRGERARIYADPKLRERVKKDFPESIEWPTLGLPRDYLPLLARGRRAFTTEGSHLVAHGGILLEEVVVPFIRIDRRAP